MTGTPTRDAKEAEARFDRRVDVSTIVVGRVLHMTAHDGLACSMVAHALGAMGVES